MPTIQLGNTAVLEPFKPDEGTNETEYRKRADLGQRVTTISIPAGWDLEETLRTVRLLWGNVSQEAPAWVEADDELVQRAVGDALGCDEGRPKNWKEGK
jgi:hypothetical protein